MPFETPLAAGEFDVVTSPLLRLVHEEGPGPHPPTTIIRTDQPWHDPYSMGYCWQCHRHDHWQLASPCLSGNPSVLGHDLDFLTTNEHIIPLTPKTPPATVHYHKHPDIRAGVVPAGPYKLIVAVTYIDADGNPGEMAGYWEGPIIQFYNA